MKPRVTIIVYDDTFGFGSRVGIVEAEISEKTIDIRGTKTRRRGFTAWAVATRELATEAKAINEQAAALQNRMCAFREKLKAAPKILDDTNSKPAPTAKEKKQALREQSKHVRNLKI